MRIVKFGNNELYNAWLAFKDIFFHPLSSAIYIDENKVDTIQPHLESNSLEMSLLEKDLNETFKQFVSVYCSDHVLGQSNSFLMEGRVWRLFDSVMNSIERNEQMNNVEFLQNSLFIKELEYVDLQLKQSDIKDTYIMPEGKKLHFGVPFYVSHYERLLLIKNYLEERIEEWNTPSETNQLER